MKIVALIPAYNEESEIKRSIQSVLRQVRRPDTIVVIPNGCTDGTAAVGRQFEPDITVMELPKLRHGKSEAMNRAWLAYAQDADLVITLDADTLLPPMAVRDWEQEFLDDHHRQEVMNRIAPRAVRQVQADWWSEEITDVPIPRRRVTDRPLGGSSGKFTFYGRGFLARMQRLEFATCINQALRRGYTSVLAGAGCAISGAGCRVLAARNDRDGPWSYDSLVEDYELTYRLRELGYRTAISPTVRAYTDPMKTNRALYGQRMKWSTGMLRDLLRFGLNRLTWQQWAETLLTFVGYGFRILWLTLLIIMALMGTLSFHWIWWVVIPLLFIAVQVKAARRIPHRDRTDVLLALAIIPAEIYSWLRFRWFFAAWGAVLVVGPIRRLIRRAGQDRWAMQRRAEAWGHTMWQKVQNVTARVVGSAAILGVTVILVGAAIPGLGIPNAGAYFGLAQPEPPEPGTEHIHRIDIPPPVGYQPPERCDGYVALTYDDGPNEYSVELADTMKAFGLRGTFFLLGSNVQKDPATVMHLVATGHWVGAHGMTHASLVNPITADDSPEAVTIYGENHELSKPERSYEIAGSAAAIHGVTGLYPAYFRPPFGESDRSITKIVQAAGMEEAFWTKDSQDWKGKSAEEIGQFFSKVEAGDIVLLHDDEEVDVRAIPYIAEELVKKNLCTGTLIQGEASGVLCR